MVVLDKKTKGFQQLDNLNAKVPTRIEGQKCPHSFTFRNRILGFDKIGEPRILACS